MLDWHRMSIIHAQHWNRMDNTDENTVNGFQGEWNISDHDLIPASVKNFVMESFPRKEKLSAIPIKDVNRVLNEAWQGPGSMTRLVMFTEQARQARSETYDVPFRVGEETSLEDFVNSHPTIEGETFNEDGRD